MFIFSHLFLFFLVFCLHKRTTAAAALSLLNSTATLILGSFFRRECNARQHISFHYYLLGGLEKWEKNIDWEGDCLTSPYFFFFFYLFSYDFTWNGVAETSRYVLEGIDVGWQERNCGTRVDKKKCQIKQKVWCKETASDCIVELWFLCTFFALFDWPIISKSPTIILLYNRRKKQWKGEI